MTQSTPTPTASSPSSRPVLLWQEQGDVTRIEPSVELAAEFLKVGVADVRSAIDAGDVLGGWFVDWEAKSTSAR
jgi:hypothetical protein